MNRISIGKMIKANYKTAIILVILVALSSFLTSFPLLIFEKAINLINDATKTSNAKELLNPLIITIVIYLLFQIFGSIFSNILSYYTTLTEAKISHKVRLDIYSHLAKLPQDFFDNNDSTIILNKVIEDSKIAASGFLHPIIHISRALFTLVFGLLFMMKINIKMTLLILPFALVAGLITSLSSGRFRMLAKEAREKNESLWSYYQESIKGIRDIHALSKEEERLLVIDKTSEGVVSNVKKASFFAAFISVVNHFSFIIIIGAMILISGLLIINGADITIGGVAAILMYNTLLQEPIKNLVSMFVSLYKVSVSLKRLNVIYETKVDEAYDHHKEASLDLTKPLEVKNLQFSYNTATPLLENISLKINNGEKVALVGKTGSGKTTILKLIFGLYLNYQGEISLFNNLVDDNNKLSLRKHISYVFQDTFLFNSSIKENILFANPTCSKEEYQKILKIALVDEIIEKLEKKDETLIGENGIRLSGGERQRIGIARALIRNPKLLILDEATSALDNKSEKRIIDNISSNYEHLPILMVAHRLTTTQKCNQIYLIENGKIVESGSHDELMKLNQKYHELYSLSLLSDDKS